MFMESQPSNQQPLRSDTAFVSVSQATKTFGELDALKSVSTSIAEHEVVTLIGPSGSGKSTLLRTIAHLEALDSGTVTVDGTVLNEPRKSSNSTEKPIAPAHRSQLIGLVFQNFELFPHMTAVDNVASGLIHVRKMPKRDARKEARNQLDVVGLSEKYDNYPSQLSGGQQQRVGIARALAMSPKVMLFDEPTSALDPETVNEVLLTMRHLSETGMTMLIATHEMEFARDVSDKTIFMEAGEIIEESPSHELFTNPKTARCRAFLSKFLSDV